MDGLTISNSARFLDSQGISQSHSLQKQSSAQSEGDSFAVTLKDAIQQVNELQKSADVKAQELATGKTDDIAGVMLATEKADIALRTMVQVRNKIIDAYQEIMRMQV